MLEAHAEHRITSEMFDELVMLFELQVQNDIDIVPEASKEFI